MRWPEVFPKQSVLGLCSLLMKKIPFILRSMIIIRNRRRSYLTKNASFYSYFHRHFPLRMVHIQKLQERESFVSSQMKTPSEQGSFQERATVQAAIAGQAVAPRDWFQKAHQQETRVLWEVSTDMAGNPQHLEELLAVFSLLSLWQQLDSERHIPSAVHSQVECANIPRKNAKLIWVEQEWESTIKRLKYWD